jgi:hypothetical protein
MNGNNVTNPVPWPVDARRTTVYFGACRVLRAGDAGCIRK